MLTQPLIQVALSLQHDAETGHPELLARAWRASQTAAETLTAWNAPLPTVLAALLAPLREHGLCPVQSLDATFGEEAVDLSERLIAIRSQMPVIDNHSSNAAAQYSLHLRRLLHLAYLDLPRLTFILLLLADHDGRFDDEAPASPLLAAETEAVFVPLAEMLGMWNLRRRWLERALRILQPSEYQEMERLLGNREAYSAGAMRSLVQTWSAGTGTAPRRESPDRGLLEKAQAFLHLQSALIERCLAEGMRVLPRAYPIQPFPSLALLRSRQSEPRGELANYLSVRVLCHSVQDCYRVLGIVHSLGKPVAPRFSERFDDYLASPQPNGYQALHTAITCSARPGSSGGILVEFRILTPSMLRLNEWGIVAALCRRPRQYRDVGAWWGRKGLELQKPLREHEPGTRSERLYVFSPRGDVYMLDDGSTALDFAYRIHTQLGHNAAKVEVNGKVVPYNYPLHNGDLVRVHYDPQFLGPDLAWLGFANTSRARGKIRGRLTNRAQATHVGRARLEDALLKTCQAYRRDKRFDLNITTSRLDAFLLRTARQRGLQDLTSIYAEIADNRLSPDGLVRRLISDELAPALMGAGGGRLPYPLYRITLCNACRPVPGDPIIGVERHSTAGQHRLMVHCQSAGLCRGKPAPENLVPVQWSEQARASGQEYLVFQIRAEDRHRLLDDLLGVVYRVPGAYLYQVEARAYTDGTAGVEITVGALDMAHLVEVQAGLEAAHSVRQVVPLPASPAQRLTFVAPDARQQPNPYTESEVSDRLMFYDREPQIAAIVKWLEGQAPARWLILHGQRRAGKTSLAKYLVQEALPERRLALPVFVDLQGLAGSRMDNLSSYVLQAVYQELRRPTPPRESGEEATAWLKRGLAQAGQIPEGRRLLIIADEFDVLLEKTHGGIDSTLFANLRVVMDECQAVSWMLIVSEAVFGSPERWGAASVLFQRGFPVKVPYLDPQWAVRLVQEPMQRCRLEFEDESLPLTIYECTAGNPYLIQSLGYRLVNRVRFQKRTNITAQDVRHATDLLIAEGARYFDHFLRNLSGIRRIVTSATAAYCGPGEWLDMPVLIERLQAKARRLQAASIQNAVRALVGQGVLMVRVQDGVEQVSIPIRLFGLWVQRNVDLDLAIQQWHTRRGAASESGV